MFKTPEAYQALYLDHAADFRRKAQTTPRSHRSHWLALGREAVHYARRMRRESF